LAKVWKAELALWHVMTLETVACRDDEKMMRVVSQATLSLVVEVALVLQGKRMMVPTAQLRV
jgi:hypothetical protein